MSCTRARRSSSRGTFAAAVVFPGGAIEPDDASPDWEPLVEDYGAFDDAERAHRIGAIRETWEETSILVGNAAEGQAYFDTKCAGCHSATGDLKGIAARISDPKMLQNSWVAGGGRGGRGRPPASAGKPVTVTVTPPEGHPMEGRLVRIDDFVVTLQLPDGATRSIRRDGDVPKVEVHDPLSTHRELLSVYTDKNIHDVTAYLVTLK